MVSHAAVVHVRFWSKVDASAGSNACWPWTGARFPAGYGAIKIGSRPFGAHRIAWELVNGPIPDGLQALHTCDNPPCVNPGHLFLGSQGDNARDMFGKGRGNPAGVATKLTADDAATIHRDLAAGVPRRALAERFGVHVTMIDKIAEGRRWRRAA